MAEVSQIESRDSEYKGINLHPYFSWHFTDTYNATSNPTGYWSNAPFNEYGQKLSDGWCHFELDNREGTATARSDFTVKNLGNTKDGSLYTVMLEFRNVNINKDGDSFYTVQSTAQVWGQPGTTAEPNATYGGFQITNAQLRQLSNGQGVFYKNILTNYKAKNNITTNIPMFMCLTWNVSTGQKVSADVRISVYEGANYRGPYVPFDPNTPVNPNFLKSIRTLTAAKVPNLLSDPTFGTALGTYWINTGLGASISNNSIIIDGSITPTSYKRIYQPEQYFSHQAGKKYTVSCDIVATQNCQISFGRIFEGYNDFGVTFDVTTTEQHLSGSYIATRDAGHATYTFNIGKVSNSATVTIKNLRLEVTENPNLLGDTINPNFTGGNTIMPYPQYWFGSGGNGVCTIEDIMDSPVSTHSKSFRIMNNSSGNRDFQIRMHRFIIPGQKYIFTGYARAINTTSVTGLVRFYSDVANFQWTGSIGKEWTKIHIIMTTGSWSGSNDASVMFGLTGAGSIEYIAPTLTKLEPTDQRVRRNLIWDTQWNKLNSDSWASWGSPTTREIVEIDGKRWLHLVTTTTQYQGWQQDCSRRSGKGAQYTQDVQELIPGAEYTVSFDAYASEATTVASIIGFHWKDKRGTILSQNWSSANLTTTPQRFSFQYVVPTNATSFNVMIGDSSTTAHELWISNLFFTKGPSSNNYNKRYQPAPEDCDEAVAGFEESNPNLYAIKRAHDGYIDYATGYIDPMDNVNAEQTSDFIPVTVGEHIYFQAWSRVTDATNHWIGYGLYNSNKQFISRTAKYDGIKDVNGFIYNYYDITIPSGAAYIRCSYRRNREGYAKVERGNLPTNWTPALEDIPVNSCPRNILSQEHMMKSFNCNQTEYTSYKTPQLTANADGWIHVSYDNSANTANQDLYWMPPMLKEIVPGRPYTILIEIKNFTSTQPYTSGTFSYIQQENGKQFWGGEGYYGHGVGASSNNVNTYIARVDVETTGAFTQRIIKKAEDVAARMTNPQKYLFRWRNYIRPQSVTSFDVRFSIYEGFYWGTYKPCLEYHNYDLRDDYSTWGGVNRLEHTANPKSGASVQAVGFTMVQSGFTVSYSGDATILTVNNQNVERYYRFMAPSASNNALANLGLSNTGTYILSGYVKTAMTSIDAMLTVRAEYYQSAWTPPAKYENLITGTGGSDRVYGKIAGNNATEWTKFAMAVTIPETANPTGFYISLQAHPHSTSFTNDLTVGDVVQFRRLKFEQANKATDWSPAPEELMRYIGDETIELYSE